MQYIVREGGSVWLKTNSKDDAEAKFDEMEAKHPTRHCLELISVEVIKRTKLKQQLIEIGDF